MTIAGREEANERLFVENAVAEKEEMMQQFNKV